MAAKRIQVNFPGVNNLMPDTKKMFLKAFPWMVVEPSRRLHNLSSPGRKHGLMLLCFAWSF
jgi:hypothetical protein